MKINLNKKKIILIIIILVIFIYLNIKNKNKILGEKNLGIESFNNPKNNYICFLCVKLSDNLLETAKNMEKYNYKIFIVVDNNDKILPKKINNINIIQMDDNKCINLGYKNASATLKKNPVTWDKAFYYFSNKDIQFDNVWFIEEDVFIPKLSLIKDFDEKYPNEDLICKENIAHETDNLKWHWKRAEGIIEKPWYRSLLCCHRQSRRLLQKVRELCEKNNQLLFLELMIPTLANQNNFKIKELPNLKTITWRNKFNFEEIKNNKNNLYHPFKNLDQQKLYRKLL